MKIVKYQEKQFREFAKRVKPTLTPFEKSMFSDLTISFFYNYDVNILLDDHDVEIAFLITKFTPSNGYLSIHFQWTDKEYRGIGLSRRLMENALRESPLTTRIFVVCATLESVAFYNKKGFICYGMYSHGGLLMEKDLKDSAKPRKSQKQTIIPFKVYTKPMIKAFLLNTKGKFKASIIDLKFFGIIK